LNLPRLDSLYVIEENISVVSQMEYNSTNLRVIGEELSTKNTTSVVIEQLVYFGSAAEHHWNELLQETASCVQTENHISSSMDLFEDKGREPKSIGAEKLLHENVTLVLQKYQHI
jgi:hypothetical protein